MLPLKGKLTKEATATEGFQFTGEIQIMVVGGSGKLEIQRSLKGSPYYCLTDTAGEKAVYEASEGVMINASLVNNSSSCSYRLEASEIEGEIEYIICK